MVELFGNTITPLWGGIVFTGLRVPLAILLSKIELLGIDGVWWSISSTSIVKGILLLSLFIIMVVRPNMKKMWKKLTKLQ